MVRKGELLPEMRAVKSEKQLDLLFLAIVSWATQNQHLNGSSWAKGRARGQPKLTIRMEAVGLKAGLAVSPKSPSKWKQLG